MKLRLLASLLACVSTPLFAQPTNAELDARLKALEKAIGISFLNSPQMSESTFKATQLNSTNELSSGEYNLGVAQKLTTLIIRDQRTDLNAVAARPVGVDPAIVTQVQSIEGRLPPAGRTVQEYVNSAVASVSVSPVFTISGTGAGYVTGFGGGVKLKEGHLESLFFTTTYDRAARWLSNTCGDSIQFGHTYCDVTLPQMRIDMEQDGAVGIGIWKPHNVPAGEWDTGGKTFVFAGHNPSTNQRGPNAIFSSGHVRRGLGLGVSRTSANVVNNGIGDILISGTDSWNPVWVTLDGSLRKLVPCGSQVCWQ